MSIESNVRISLELLDPIDDKDNLEISYSHVLDLV